MLAQSIIYLPSIFGAIGIGLFVLARSRQVVFRLFGFFCSSLAIWLFFQYLTDLKVGNGTLWLQLASVALCCMTAFFLLFVYVYPDRMKVPRKFYVMALLPLVIFVPLSFTPLLVKNVTSTAAGVSFTPGPLFILQTVFLIVYMGISLAILLSRLRRVSIAQKMQIYSLLYAFVIGLVGNVLAGAVFANSLYWQAARPLSILAMVMIIAYAMIYQRLFDIRTYVVRTVTYSITLALVAVIYMSTTLIATRYAIHVSLSPSAIVYFAVSTFIVAILFQPLRIYFNRLTNHLFYRDYYEPQELVDRLSSLLVGTVDIKEIQEKTRQIFETTLKPTFSSFLLTANNSSSERELLRVLLGSQLDIILTDEVSKTQSASIYKALRSLDAAMVIRLRTKHEDLGFLVLGARRSGQIYSSQDRRIVSVVADELAIGLQNAIRFREIESFNATLQQRIEEATRKLRSSNDKLRKLDQTKDDFISMASHQLRTPLTSVKGYVSMVLDGDAGKITTLQRKLLNQSFISSQRMVYLISDLLNVSRLKTGKFIIEAVPTNLAKVIQEEVEQLVETVKGRNLQLTYHKPEHFPTLMIDETKLRQVIMNFIDNAVYYTPSGGHISVELVDKPQTIEFTVTDDGIGVPRHEQHHLFSKFYRANNAQRARPDGTGLGLFMAKKVIVAQGGALIFKSQEGRGSTFGFTFAKAKLLPAETPATTPPNTVQK